MPVEKRALYCTFTPKVLPSTESLKAQYEASFPIFAGMDSVEFKIWWVDQDRGQWGALYVFRSAAELEKYISSDLWLHKVPQKYNCTPVWKVIEPALILSKEIITEV